MEINLLDKKDLSSLLEKINSIEQKVDALNTSAISKGLYSVPEVCKLLKVSRRTLQKYRDEGKISFTQVGSKILFQEADIKQFLKNNQLNAFHYDRKKEHLSIN